MKIHLPAGALFGSGVGSDTHAVNSDLAAAAAAPAAPAAGAEGAAAAGGGGGGGGDAPAARANPGVPMEALRRVLEEVRGKKKKVVHSLASFVYSLFDFRLDRGIYTRSMRSHVGRERLETVEV